MEDRRVPSEKHPLQGPHRDLRDARERERELPAGFVPLRLVLESVGLRIEVWRAEVIVGRHSQAEVRLALPDISRRHCRLRFADGHWRVHDLGSLNGVFVNGDRMHEAALHDGDHLQLGKFAFRVEQATPASASGNVLQSIVEVMKEAG